MDFSYQARERLADLVAHCQGKAVQQVLIVWWLENALRGKKLLVQGTPWVEDGGNFFPGQKLLRVARISGQGHRPLLQCKPVFTVRESTRAPSRPCKALWRSAKPMTRPKGGEKSCQGASIPLPFRGEGQGWGKHPAKHHSSQ